MEERNERNDDTAEFLAGVPSVSSVDVVVGGEDELPGLRGTDSTFCTNTTTTITDDNNSGDFKQGSGDPILDNNEPPSLFFTVNSSSLEDSDVGGGGSSELLRSMSERQGPTVSAPHSSRRAFTQRKLSDFAMGRLRHQKLPFVGRETEIKMLGTALDDACLRSSCTTNNSSSCASTSALPSSPNDQQQRQCHLVCIGGKSGSGKTALVKEALQKPARRRRRQHKLLNEPQQHPLPASTDGNSISLERSSLSSVFCVSGKFDYIQRDEPFVGLQPAMIELGHQIIELQQQQQKQQQKQQNSLPARLIEGLGSELSLLTSIMPNLADVVGAENVLHSSNAVRSQAEVTEAVPSTKNLSSLRQSADRLKFLLRKFIRIVTRHTPLVIILDDVQWSDSSSLLSVTSLLIDTTISNLMIVCCYRTDVESDIQPFLDTVVKPIQLEYQESRHIRLTELELGGIDVSQVAEILATCLSIDNNNAEEYHPQTTTSTTTMTPASDDDSTLNTFAKLVHKRTGGNVFHITQFLSSLVRDKLLTYDAGRAKWTWDINNVRTHSTVTVNVVDLVQEKLIHSSLPCKEWLLLGACLGARFNQQLLTKILDGFCDSTYNSELYKDAFGVPPAPFDTQVIVHWVEEGVIESVSSMSASTTSPNGKETDEFYQFIHDKIQEASLAMISNTSLLPKVRYTIGYILFQTLPQEELDGMAFMVADLLQAAPQLLPKDGSERLNIVLLNQSAGENSIRKSAFASALNFYRNAISLLPDDHWETLCDLSLDLYSSVAECALATGDFATMRGYGSKVLDNPEISILQKMRVAYVTMDADIADYAKDRQVDATRVGLNVLRELGCPLPKSSLMVNCKSLLGLLETKRSVKKKKLYDIQKLARSNDPTVIAVLKTLDKLTTASFITKPEIMPLCIVTSVKWTRRYGYTEYSAPAMAWNGLLLGSFMGDWDGGHAFGQACLEIAKNLDETVSRSNLIAYTYVVHFLLPFEKCIDPLLEAYENGLSTGDVESAMWSIFFYLHLHWLIGTGVERLLRDGTAYSRIMKDFGQIQQHRGASYWTQLFENLVAGPETSKLNGSAYNEDIGVPEMENAGDFVQLSAFYIAKLSACGFFGDFLEGADLAVKHTDNILKFLPGQAVLTSMLFMSGLCCYAMATTTKEAKFNRHAEKCRKKLKQWVRHGNPNCLHYESLLDAEKERYRGNKWLCVKHYESAILLAGRRGLTQYQALGNERFASYWRSVGNEEEAEYRFQESLRLYRDWGVNHKVELLLKSVPSVPKYLELSTN